MPKIIERYFGKSVWAAPLAGVTDKAYRQVIMEVCAGSVHTITEMVSCHALRYNNQRTLAMLDLAGEPEPRTVQIFGADPVLMAEAARRVTALGATGININMGCPVPKVAGNGEGAALLKDVPLAVEIARAVAAGVGTEIPVSVKTRLGWDADHIVAVDLARRLEQVGVAALMVHARTRDQYYTGEADWSWLARVKQEVRMPVIGNGDIWSPADAVRMMRQTGCDGVMLGRGMLGNPWLAAAVARAVAEMPEVPEMLGMPEIPEIPRMPEIPVAEKRRVIRRHMELLMGYKGEATAVREMRKHALWYTKGVRGAARLRGRITRAPSVAEFEALMDEVFAADPVGTLWGC